MAVCTRRDVSRSSAVTNGALCAMTSGRSRKPWWFADSLATLLHSRPLREWVRPRVGISETGCVCVLLGSLSSWAKKVTF